MIWARPDAGLPTVHVGVGTCLRLGGGGGSRRRSSPRDASTVGRDPNRLCGFSERVERGDASFTRLGGWPWSLALPFALEVLTRFLRHSRLGAGARPGAYLTLEVAMHKKSLLAVAACVTALAGLSAAPAFAGEVPALRAQSACLAPLLAHLPPSSPVSRLQSARSTV